jgi:A/G-specific adenine glycosylase
MLCTPKSPDCAICPVRQGCYAFSNGKVQSLPVKVKTMRVRERFFIYIVYTDGEKMLMNKRDERDIWANMYDFPLIETPSHTALFDVTKMLQFKSYFGDNVNIINAFPAKKHVLTHQHIYAQFIQVDQPPIKLEQKWFFLEIKKLKILALPKIINIFIDNFFN